MAMVDAALRYADHGWPVFPVRGKTPLTTNGFKNATTNPGIIKYWWDKYREANIAVSSGPAGLVVIDLDDPQDQDLVDRLPPTATVQTRPGREHRIYTGLSKSHTDVLGGGIDIRSEGGYFVVPPSMHPDTNEPYEWLDKQTPVKVPEWVLEKLEEEDSPRVNIQANGGKTTRYGATALDALQAEMLRAKENRNRNITLFRTGVRVSELVKAGEVEGQPAFDGLRRAARAAGLGTSEIERTLGSAWQRAKPKHRPEPSDHPFEALDLPQLREMPPPSWILPDVLPEGLSLLIGRYGSLKTWLAMDMAATAALAGVSVVYFVGEDVAGFSSRVVDLADAHLVELDNLRVVPDVPRLLRPGEEDRLKAVVEEHQAELIVIDTWATAMPGAEENSFGDNSRGVDVLRSLDCSVLVVAHTGASDFRMRGHTSVEDAADCVWHAVEDDEAPSTARVTNKKMKNSPLMPSLEIFLRSKDDTTILAPSLVDSLQDWWRNE